MNAQSKLILLIGLLNTIVWFQRKTEEGYTELVDY